MIHPSREQTDAGERPPHAGNHAKPALPSKPRSGQQARASDPQPNDDLGHRLESQAVCCRRAIVERQRAQDEKDVEDAPSQHRDPTRRLSRERERRRREAAQFPEGEHEGPDREGHDEESHVIQGAPWLADREEETDGHQA